MAVMRSVETPVNSLWRSLSRLLMSNRMVFRFVAASRRTSHGTWPQLSMAVFRRRRRAWQQGKREGGLGQRFASRQGDAAARAAVKEPVLFHHVEDILHALALSVGDNGRGRAGGHAGFFASGTRRPVEHRLVVHPAYGMVRAGIKAAHALGQAKTAPFVEGQLNLEGLGFRVAAPAAQRGQPLKKTIVRIPGPSCTEYLWMLKIVPLVFLSS